MFCSLLSFHIYIYIYIYRYQDDLIIFQQYYNAAYNIVNSYPQEMIIKNTNVNINTVNYLDLTTVNDRLSPRGLICQNDFLGSIFKV